MKTMVLETPGEPLRLKEIPIPVPESNQVLIKVIVCGVCRTDLHIVDGELTSPKLPLVLGHQIVGVVQAVGSKVSRFKAGDRVGVPWLGWTDNTCEFCREGKENLCEKALFTGYTVDGGFAEFTVADERYCFHIPEIFTDTQAAPLLCAGLIGYRAYSFVKEKKSIALLGFGASAHILTQIAAYQDKKVYAFTRAGDTEGQAFALSLGAYWAGDTQNIPVKKLDGAIIFAPSGDLIPKSLSMVKPGSTVVCAGIHMSQIPSFSYDLLWGERVLMSVANLTRKDGEEFFKIAPEIPVRTTVNEYPLERANDALSDLRRGRFRGAAVLKIGK
jgi:alcohol dehydrogenase, propanol-preferring